MYLRDFLVFKPFHDCSLCSVCISPQPAFYSQSAVCIFPLVRSLQSAVRSLRFTLTEFKLRDHMDRRITLPEQVTSPTWGPLPP